MEKHVISGKVTEQLFNEVKDINLELKKVISDVDHICLTCSSVVKAPIFGLYDKNSGALVCIMKGHEVPFLCKPCRKRIELLKKEKK